MESLIMESLISLVLFIICSAGFVQGDSESNSGLRNFLFRMDEVTNLNIELQNQLDAATNLNLQLQTDIQVPYLYILKLSR